MTYNTKSLLRDLEGKIVPQGFDVAADNYRALTGQNLGNNRFGLDGIQWGKTETGLFVPMAVTDEGHVKVQQVGTIGIVKVFDEYQIRDTNIHSVTVDVSKLKGIYVIAYNATNQPIRLEVFPERWEANANAAVHKLFDKVNDQWTELNRVVNLEGYQAYHLNSFWGFFNDSKQTIIRFEVSANTAPTVGNLNLTIWGEPV